MSSNSATSASTSHTFGTDPARGPRALPADSPSWLRIVIALIAFGILTPMALSGTMMEYAFMNFINQPAQQNELLDYLMNAFSYQKLITGVPLMAGICAIWCMPSIIARRGDILICTLAAFVTSLVSRVMQIFIPANPRPLQDQALGMTPPFNLSPEFHDLTSFPSDHAVVFIGLGYVIWRFCRPLGILAMTFAVLVSFSRAYMGFHFATDIIAGGILSVIVIELALLTPFRRLGAWVADFSRTHPAWFYGVAFMACYAIATLLEEPRELLSGLAGMI
ncbi:phosphatase PAP2 family protein [Kushneria indalinina]|nr:phosphatase PAP2 family protein [Kushneria indalinina]